jgi:hypothetical protein
MKLMALLCVTFTARNAESLQSNYMKVIVKNAATRTSMILIVLMQGMTGGMD